MFLNSRILKSYNLRPDFIHFIERIDYPSGDHDLLTDLCIAIGDAHGNSKQGPNVVTAGCKMIIF